MVAALAKHRRLNACCIFIFMLVSFTTLPALAVQLSDFMWDKRPLLIFAQDHQDERLVHTLRALEKQNCQMDNRDMILGIIVTQGRSNLDRQDLSTQYASALRSNYVIKGDDFTVLLIGKDGGEKFRSNTIPVIDEIFAVIDGMPMRQYEMLDNQADCKQPSS